MHRDGVEHNGFIMSKIEWTELTWNPTTGCDKVSAGCRFCYAEKMHKRLRAMGQAKYQHDFLGGAHFHPEELARPFGWKSSKIIFVDSMSDLYHDHITVQQIAEVYAVMFLNPQHTFQVLSKRAKRRAQVLESEDFFLEYHKACNRLHDQYIKNLSETLYFEEELRSMWPLRNVWEGTSTEDQEQLNDRGHWLARTPASTRFISYEPALGPVDLYSVNWSVPTAYDAQGNGIEWTDPGPGFVGIDWVIAGGESGNKRLNRPAHIQWFRNLRDQCAKSNVKFFFKQWGSFAPASPQPSGTDGKYLLVSDNGEFVRTNSYPRQMVMYGSMLMQQQSNKSLNILDGRTHLEMPKIKKPQDHPS